MITATKDERVTTQVIILIKRYEKMLLDRDRGVDPKTLEKVIFDLKNELYKYKPSATFDLYEDNP